jgi:hypothetical protein
MRKSIVIAVLTLAFLGGPVLSPAAAGQAAPVASLPEKSFNFDPVVEGTEVVHDFVIQNTGNGDLKIHRVSTG